MFILDNLYTPDDHQWNSTTTIIGNEVKKRRRSFSPFPPLTFFSFILLYTSYNMNEVFSRACLYRIFPERCRDKRGEYVFAYFIRLPPSPRQLLMQHEYYRFELHNLYIRLAFPLYFHSVFYLQTNFQWPTDRLFSIPRWNSPNRTNIESKIIFIRWKIGIT